MTPKTAVILDAFPLWLEAVSTVLARVEFEVVCKTTSCEDALAVVAEAQPDLLVADVAVHSPDDGLDCLRRARHAAPEIRMVALSTSADPGLIDAALAAGAAAYVMKSAHPDDLSAAIRQAFDRSMYIRRPLHADADAASAPQREVEREAQSVSLTKREREILKLVAEGYSNGQLARLLWVTEPTVKFHLSNVYRKLNVSNRTEAARWAQLNRLLPTTAHAVVGNRDLTAA